MTGVEAGCDPARKTPMFYHSCIGSMYSTIDRPHRFQSRLCCYGFWACLLSRLRSRQVRRKSGQPRALNLTYILSYSRDNKSLVLAIVVIHLASNRTLSLSVKVEAQTVVTRLATKHQVKSIVNRAASESREAVDTRRQRQVDPIRSTLVDDVEEEAHVVAVFGFGVVVGGEVVTLGDVHALVVVAETLESVVGQGDLCGCRSPVADYACDAHSGSEPACAGADGDLYLVEVGWLVWGLDWRLEIVPC